MVGFLFNPSNPMPQKMTRSASTPSRGQRHTFVGEGGAAGFDHEVLDIARVVRVVKGGRRFRFRASVVVGDRFGKVGFGVGKSRDVQSAIQKAQAAANKAVISVPLQHTTITHPVKAKSGGTIVMLRPARRGTGIIAGGTVRVVADLAGIKNLVAKTYGSTNKINTTRATLQALKALG